MKEEGIIFVGGLLAGIVFGLAMLATISSMVNYEECGEFTLTINYCSIKDK